MQEAACTENEGKNGNRYTAEEREELEEMGSRRKTGKEGKRKEETLREQREVGREKGEKEEKGTGDRKRLLSISLSLSL